MAERKTRGRAKKPLAILNAIEKRARGSSISRRELNRPTDADIQRAEKELADDDSTNSAADEPNIIAQRLDARAFSTGRRVGKKIPRDDETTARTVRKGIDKAERDEMVAAGRNRTKTEG